MVGETVEYYNMLIEVPEFVGRDRVELADGLPLECRFECW